MNFQRIISPTTNRWSGLQGGEMNGGQEGSKCKPVWGNEWVSWSENLDKNTENDHIPEKWLHLRLVGWTWWRCQQTPEAEGKLSVSEDERDKKHNHNTHTHTPRCTSTHRRSFIKAGPARPKKGLLSADTDSSLRIGAKDACTHWIIRNGGSGCEALTQIQHFQKI